MARRMGSPTGWMWDGLGLSCTKCEKLVSATSFVSVCEREGGGKTIYQENRHRCLFSKLKAAKMSDYILISQFYGILVSPLR